MKFCLKYEVGEDDSCTVLIDNLDSDGYDELNDEHCTIDINGRRATIHIESFVRVLEAMKRRP